MERNHEHDEEFVAGKHPVMEALRSGRSVNKIWVADQGGGGKPGGATPIIAEAKKLGVLVQFVDKRKLDSLVPGVQHQGVVAQVAPYAYAELDQIVAAARAEGQTPFLLILDEIEDPHNLGSILRTADCTGVHGVIIPKRRSVGVTVTVSKISAGAAAYVPVAKVTNIAQTIEELKEQGFWVAGTDVTAKQSVHQADFTMPLALVIGNEHKGVSRLVRDKCDFLVKLPMVGHVDSLNASVAAGVLMYEVLRQRQAGQAAATGAGAWNKS
ncbi:23S rRNA (guanosine(2251)-2'-O)-methyltransferase RlmB [Paenibacillus turpanensis]|uniref:23S rRNA (guanosine(2251)-2'-O)-methyltransferase RlmB n=1 Tax=Paenibacillus turpanensis TaxID=2689078 RepID=UPI0014075336|nr:23S rRNA (guanosine(2251)-2'-O)-methyltransferase RlmB [Paenibacillus turpanensis]